MSETIAAIATGQAAGGIGVIRISGDNAVEVADRVFSSVSGKGLCEMKGYRASYGKVQDGRGWSDEAVALVFRAPHSYTGEDVVELSCHGGLFCTRCTLEACLAAGARLALPGEFTKRAFLNGKLSLDQAESVMAIINAEGRSAALAAERARDTRLSEKMAGICEKLEKLAARIAVSEEFPDEIDYELDSGEVQGELEKILDAMEGIVRGSRLGKMVREGIETVIVGKPNVGKSTLMNLLAGCEKSIVTSIPGTTRDVVEEKIMLGDCPLLISDTAGLHDTDDPVEAIGVERARSRLASASLVIAVFDSSESVSDEDIAILESIKNMPAVAVINKSDREQRLDVGVVSQMIPYVVKMSASTGEGLEELKEAVLKLTELERLDPAANILINARQLECAERALGFIRSAYEYAGHSADMAGLLIRDALDALLELTGEKADGRIIDEIFENFCVGK